MKVYDHIPEDQIEWARQQKMFWVATAPLSDSGHVNVSPKGILGTTFCFVDKNRVWYEDLTGSGIETLAHLRENGRITILFHAFSGGPRILRLHGRGVVHEFGTPEYERYISSYERSPGSRGVIVVDVHRASTSCGFAIPFYEYKGDRLALDNFALKKEEKGALQAYWEKSNLKSIDGLPGMQNAHRASVAPATVRQAVHEVQQTTPTATDLQRKRDTVCAVGGFFVGLLVAIMVMRFSVQARQLVLAL
ncbi:hypothetical protein K488DRAFT_47351 [Vararia minispora EC-137]|uniref:Uncharacterized protein n=1 Tax=Vararia minispora EC-137 TaxID=1314806 RepID=A0ACB8QP61_9AGAM|nr:hypothetical protein K488DRAFT_47351 [Vararia minispora EC-137]